MYIINKSYISNKILYYYPCKKKKKEPSPLLADPSAATKYSIIKVRIKIPAYNPGICICQNNYPIQVRYNKSLLFWLPLFGLHVYPILQPHFLP